MQAGDSKMFLGETAAQQIVKRGTLKIREKKTHTQLSMPLSRLLPNFCYAIVNRFFSIFCFVK